MARPLLVLLAVVSLGLSSSLQAQPAEPAQSTRARAQARPVNVTVKVTDGAGLGLQDVEVTMTGPVTREGTLLTLPNASFLVADACSGFATLYAAVGVAIVLAAHARSWPRRLLLLVAAWPLAVACNIVRVTILVSAANHYGLGLLETPFHAASGVLTFWAVLALLILMADREGLRGAST